MRVRVAGIWKHPKSGIYWFRMAVPERHRTAVGKREIKQTLDTRSEVQARLKHASLLAQTTALFARLDTEADDDVDRQAKLICDRGLNELVRRNLAYRNDGVTTIDDARDNVLLGMLTVLTFRVRCSWGNGHALRAELELFGESDGLPLPATVPAALADPEEQERAVERIQALEGRFMSVAGSDGYDLLDDQKRPIISYAANKRLKGLAYRDIAAALLRCQDWRFVEMEVTLIAEAARVAVVPGSKLYDAVAERTLAVLAGFRSEQIDVFELGMAWEEPRLPLATRQKAQASSPRTLQDAFRQWCRNKNISLDDAGWPDPPHKTADEWSMALRRFEGLFGPLALTDITSEMVHEFRDVIKGLPSRPKKPVAVLPLRAQAVAAKEQALACLRPNSVKKHITAIQTMLGAAVAIKWISENVADGVTVEGAGYEGNERDFFTLKELRTIFASPLMTDPDACNDSTFFIILLETLQGGRPGELAKLKPDEIAIIDDIPTMRIRRVGGRSQKTATSVRDIPLHDIAVEAGIMDLAAIRSAEDAEWLFIDLKPDKYGDRYKLLSRKINDHLRRLGIVAKDKSFYSARHAHKRESRRQGISEANSDQMSGHSTSGSVGRKYGGGAPIETLKGDIDRVIYQGVDWEPVIACSRTRIAQLKTLAARAA